MNSRRPQSPVSVPDRRAALRAWTEPPPRPVTRNGEVHVWLLEVPELVATLRDRLPALLDDTERARSARFHFAADRDRFGVCRAAARIILGRYLGRPPASLRFVEGPRGKPGLLAGPDPPLEFNLSHSADVGMFVVSPNAVGVDVERIDASRSDDDVARRFFAAEEVERLRGLPSEARVEAFFECWTRKEAYLKARGDGLALSLASFAVAFGGGAAPALLRSALGRGEAERWKFFDPPPVPGYAAALAAERAGQDPRPAYWRLPSDFVVAG